MNSDSIKTQTILFGLTLLFMFVCMMMYTNKLPFYHEEAKRAIIAQEMLLSNNYIAPTIYSRDYQRKPPLHNIAIALLSSDDGDVSRRSARMVSILSVLIIGIAVYLLMVNEDQKRAFIAALLAAGSYQVACEFGSTAELDVFFAMLVTLSFVIYMKFPKSSIALVLSALLMGASVITKFFGPLFFYPGIILYLILNSEGRWRGFGRLGIHFLLSLAIPALWIFLYFKQVDPESFVKTAAFEANARAGTSILDFIKHFFEYPFRIFAVLFPGSLILIAAFKKNRNRDSLYKISLYLFVISLVIFTLMSSSRDRYMIPAFPFFAIVAAYHFNLEKAPGKMLKLISLGLLSVLSFGGAVYFGIEGDYLQTVVFSLVAVAPWISNRYIRDFRSYTVIIVLSVMVFYHFGLKYARSLERFDIHPMVEELAEKITLDIPVAACYRLEKSVGCHIEGLLQKQMFRSRTIDSEYYYQVSYPDKINPDGIEIIRTKYEGKPDKDLILQLVDRRGQSDQNESEN
jgi:4-amino-4-deoxy-L-arabinose transferase-like glycosyltransferase